VGHVYYNRASTVVCSMEILWIDLAVRRRALPYKTTCINSTSITQLTVSFYLWQPVEFATFTQTVMIITASH